MRSGGDCDETLDEAEVILNVLLYGAQCGSYLTPFRPRPPRVPLGEGGGGQKLAHDVLQGDCNWLFSDDHVSGMAPFSCY